MRRMGLSGLVAVTHRPDGPGDDRFLPTLAAWFTLPFAPLPPGPTAALAATGAGFRPDGATGPLSSRAVPGALTRVVSALAGPDDNGPPVALVDRHHEGPHGMLRHDDLRATARVVRSGRPDSVHLHFADGTTVASTPADLVARLLAALLAGPVLPTVADGLPRLLGRFRAGPGPVRRTGAAVLLPFPAGRAERTAVVTAGAVAVSVGAYPAVCAIVPEASPLITPLVGDGSSFLTAPPTGGVLGPAGGRGRLALHLTPFTRDPVPAAVAAGRRAGARTLRRAKHALTRPAPSTVLSGLGIDVGARRGLVTRLDAPLPSNPWLPRPGWRLLDPGAPGDVVMTVEDAP